MVPPFSGFREKTQNLGGDVEGVANPMAIRIKIMCYLGKPQFVFSKVSA